MATSTVEVSRLKVLQSFKETAWGTGPTTAQDYTAKWTALRYNGCSLKRWAKHEIIDEQRGSFSPGYTHFQPRDGADIKLTGIATYEDIIYYMMSGLGVISSSGTAAPYTWTWSSEPLLTAWDAQTYSFKWGYVAGEVIECNGATAQKISIKGETQKEWELTFDGFGTNLVNNASLTAALTDRVVTPIMFQTTQCYIDAHGGTIGTTPMTNAFVSFNLEWDTGLKPTWAGGSLGPVAFHYAREMPTLTLSLYHNATTKAVIDSMQAGTIQLIRLKSTSGANSCQIDFAGMINEDVDYFGDKEDAMTVDLKFHGIYDTTWGHYMNAVVVNSVATLP